MNFTPKTEWKEKKKIGINSSYVFHRSHDNSMTSVVDFNSFISRWICRVKGTVSIWKNLKISVLDRLIDRWKQYWGQIPQLHSQLTAFATIQLNSSEMLHNQWKTTTTRTMLLFVKHACVFVCRRYPTSVRPRSEHFLAHV